MEDKFMVPPNPLDISSAKKPEAKKEKKEDGFISEDTPFGDSILGKAIKHFEGEANEVNAFDKDNYDDLRDIKSAFPDEYKTYEYAKLEARQLRDELRAFRNTELMIKLRKHVEAYLADKKPNDSSSNIFKDLDYALSLPDRDTTDEACEYIGMDKEIFKSLFKENPILLLSEWRKAAESAAKMRKFRLYDKGTLKSQQYDRLKKKYGSDFDMFYKKMVLDTFSDLEDALERFPNIKALPQVNNVVELKDWLIETIATLTELVHIYQGLVDGVFYIIRGFEKSFKSVVDKIHQKEVILAEKEAEETDLDSNIKTLRITKDSLISEIGMIDKDIATKRGNYDRINVAYNTIQDSINKAEIRLSRLNDEIASASKSRDRKTAAPASVREPAPADGGKTPTDAVLDDLADQTEGGEREATPT